MKVKTIWTILAALFSVFVHQQLFAEEEDKETAIEDSPVVLESIECRGNSTISCDFIRQKLHLALNTKIADAEVQNAKLRLSALPNFKSVDLRLEKGSEKGKAILIVEVVEASSLLTEVVFGLGYISEVGPYIYNSNFKSNTPEESIAGRLSYQNLFGKQKILELTVNDTRSRSTGAYYWDGTPFEPAYTSYFGSGESQLNASLTYVDPNVLGLDQLFLSLNINHTQINIHANFHAQLSLQTPPDRWRTSDTYLDTSVDLHIGYRLWGYSYAFAEYSHHSEYNAADNGISIFSDKPTDNVLSLGYGWDSEDDPYFPTQGSVLSAVINYWIPPGSLVRVPTSTCFFSNSVSCNVDWSVAYKKNWLVGEHTVWTLNVGGEPLGLSDRVSSVEAPGSSETSATSVNSGTLGLRYAHLLSGSDGQGNTHRSRWYVQLGTGPIELSREKHIGGYPNLAALTVGIRFESKLFGVVDLFATGSRYWDRQYSL